MSLTSSENKTAWLAVLAVFLVCCVTGGSAAMCNQTIVFNDTMETNMSGKVLEAKDFCPNATNVQIISGADGNFNVGGVGAGTQINCTNLDAEATFNGSFANPWTLYLNVTDTTDNFLLTLVVTLQSTNDHSATITNLNPQPCNVSEDHKLGDIVARCTLTDGDYPGSGDDIPYVEIVQGNDDNRFAVDSRKCEVYLVAPLDYATKPSYNVTLTAYNLVNGIKYTGTTEILTINVIHVDRYPPICKPMTIIVSVKEGTAVGTILTKVNCTEYDGGTNVEYFRGAASYIPHLDVRQVNGEVFLNYTLKYDNNPANNTKQLIVEAATRGSPRKTTAVTVLVVVEDVDDHIPQFNQATFSGTVPATTLVGSQVLQLQAVDADAPNTTNSQITYGILDACVPDWLEIANDTGYLYLNKPLNRSASSKIECDVFAYSSTNSANTSTAKVSLTISPENNKRPVFTQFAYEGRVRENASKGVSVLRVTAIDPDGGQIRYSSPTTWPFSIDQTGEITATSDLDYEKQNYSGGLVYASDNGSPPLTASVPIFINVDPVNEFTPVMNSIPNPHVRDTVEPGTSVTSITASDGDHGEDGEVLYSLVAPADLFVIEEVTGIVRAGVGLDKTAQDSYAVVVVATDKSQSRVLSSSMTFTVVIDRDRNNDPVCQPLGPLTVTPNSQSITSAIGYLSCKDSDPNTNLSYDMVQGDSKLFEVVTYNGTVRLATTPVPGTYLIVIQVADDGSPARATRVPVQIKIEINLKYLNLPNNIQIPEDTKVTELLFTVQAVGSYDLIYYSITSGNDDSTFYIGPTSGELRPVKPLDKEKPPDYYSLEITATTKDGLSSIKGNLQITLKDVNDNPPVFYSSFYFQSVSETQPAPSSLVHAEATDPDSGPNGQIIYSIVSIDPSSHGNKFQCDSNGTLRLMSALDYTICKLYKIVLCATDRGVPALNTTTIVYIAVTPKYDQSLNIVPSGSKISISLPENSPIGLAVITVDVQDNYTKPGLLFEITGGNAGGNFTINNKTGVVYIVGPLDRESGDTMNIKVRASDANGKENFTDIIINITDENDNDPLMMPNNYAFSCAHGTPPATQIGNVTVTDRDIGVNQDTTLFITDGDPGGMFSFTGNTLINTRVLDANSQNHFNLTIMVRDGGMPSRNSTGNVIVTVRPKLAMPYFVRKPGIKYLEETFAPGSLIDDLDATALGAKETSPVNNVTGDIVYTLTSGNASLFYVDAGTGELQLLGPLFYSKATFYDLVFTATNKYNSSLHDTVNYKVILTQVNRYDPVFSNDTYFYSVLENATLGTLIGQITATDRDPGQYGVLSFAMEPNLNFSIDSTLGLVTLSAALEYSTGKSYSLRAWATDNAGVNSRTTYVVVSITVNDTNNHYPECINSPYVFSVPETLPLGTVFQTIVTRDLDSGPFGTVTCSIGSGTPFAMDRSTGALSVASKLDYETTPLHNTSVVCADGGNPPLETTVPLTVHVTDKNDNAPDFGATQMTSTIRSDTAPMQSVFQCSATDRDSGKNGMINYVIQSQSSEQLFSIDTFSGIISTTQSLESANSFQTVVVKGIDEGWPPLTGTVTILFTIQPILKPGPVKYAYSVPENEKGGTFVGTIPYDASLNNITSHRISGGNYGNAFSVITNANGEGEIWTTQPLDWETYPYYQLRVTITYTSGSINVTVGINVTDVNDNAPVCNPNPLKITMVEKIPIGTPVGTFDVTDADSPGVNSDVTMSISPLTPLGAHYFSVEDPGVIKVVQTVVYDKMSSMTFNVEVKNKGSPQLSTTLVVNIIVVDVKENKTYYYHTGFYTTRNFPDDLKEGDAAGAVSPADVGVTLGPGDTVSYAIVGSDSIFDIHPSTGVLLIRKESYIYNSAKYFQWVNIKVVSGGNKTDYLLQIRLDTFSRKMHAISIKYNIDLAGLQSSRSIVQSTLQSFYTSPQAVSIWSMDAITAFVGRRRLLAPQSEILAVVVADNATNDMANAGVPKTFLASKDAVKPLQSSSDGTPNSALASGSPSAFSATPYSNDDSSSSLDPAYIAAIVIGCIAGLVLIIALIALIVYCACFRRKKNSDKKRLVEKKKKSKEVFGNINKSKSEVHKEEQPSRGPFSFFRRKNKTAERDRPSSDVPWQKPAGSFNPDDPYSDGMPKHPTTATFISSSRTPEVPYQKNSSTMLESLEEAAEDDGVAYSSSA